jgi:hypothetical protein
MSYDYMFFRSARHLNSHDEIDEGTTVPFGSDAEILALLRELYPGASVDAEGYGWLDPAEYTGAIHLSDDEHRVFYIAALPREDVQKLCNALGLNAFDGQAMELIQPE